MRRVLVDKSPACVQHDELVLAQWISAIAMIARKPGGRSGEQDGPGYMDDHDKGAELPNGVSGHLLGEETENVSGSFDPGKEIV